VLLIMSRWCFRNIDVSSKVIRSEWLSVTGA
jgi:hypothetical protein